MMDCWAIIVNGTELVDELRRMPDEIASLQEAAESVSLSFVPSCALGQLYTLRQLVQLKFTFGEGEPLHIDLIRNRLTRALGTLLPDIQDEIAVAFNDYIPATDGMWCAICIYPMFDHELHFCDRLDSDYCSTYDAEDCCSSEQSGIRRTSTLYVPTLP